ncbi:MAG: tRNA (N6-isopentenyl adenosine(37)-C2)-methylthiotransferase MiaB [Candidatus Staskawiczbacteria bacterium]|nr:tRNA (N6-isopentenyl adenosine(37)-C2)-methylthiotransferase MiaB [Candidatus Staskawiczbacteria bacterium]
MKYHVIVYGCQMNISDAERVSAVLESIKYKKALDMNDADLVVVTMCSIRQSAVDRVHGLVEKFKQIRKTNPDFKAILTGCVLKKDKKKFVEGFNYIIDIKEIGKLPKIMSEAVNSKRALQPRGMVARSANGAKPEQATLVASVSEESLPNNYLNITPKYSSKFSAHVPIMTGCNNFCAYCVVPYAREKEVSRSSKEIILEIKNLVKNGYKEVWLLGQNVNSYKDSDITFPKLLKMVNDIPSNFWIRFTSSHPKDFNAEVINALAIGGKITPYLNLPIQSGDDKVLKSMNRHYTVKEYKDKIKELRKRIPGIAISTDIIVGFPGETKKQFENTVKLFEDVKYDMAYINKYSKRAGTAAAKLKDNVSTEEKKRREKVLTETLKQTALEKNKPLLGKETMVLFNENRGDIYFGKNEHYKTVKVKSSKNILGRLIKVKITEISPFTLVGEII